MHISAVTAARRLASMRHTAGGVAGVAGAAALVLCAAAVWRGAGAGPGARAARVALQATEVGSVGPGSMLTLQTASGPMQLTVDSQMNQGHPCAHAPIPPCPAPTDYWSPFRSCSGLCARLRLRERADVCGLRAADGAQRGGAASAGAGADCRAGAAGAVPHCQPLHPAGSVQRGCAAVARAVGANGDGRWRRSADWGPAAARGGTRGGDAQRTARRGV